MFKKLTTLVASAALSLTLISTPAVADSKNTENFVAAAALIALFGLAAHEANKKPDPIKTKKKPDPKKYSNRHYSRKSLPLTCLIKYRVQGGHQTAFGETCLEQNFRFEKQMPKQCKETLWTNKGTRSVYQPKCLRRFGYEARNYYH